MYSRITICNMSLLAYPLLIIGLLHGTLRACDDYYDDLTDADLLVYTYDIADQPPYLDIEVVEPEKEEKDPAEERYSLSPELEQVLDHWNKYR